MKKTTYILIALVIAGALAIIGNTIFFTSGGTPMKSVTIGQDMTTKPLATFSAIHIKVSPEYAHRHIISLDSNLTCNITGSRSATAPSVTMSPDWEKYLTFTLDNDTLTINFDFHGAERYDVTDENENDKTTYYTDFYPQAINLTLPSGMLRSLRLNRIVDTSISGIDSKSLEFDIYPVTFTNCDIDSMKVIPSSVTTRTTRSDDYDDSVYVETCYEPEYKYNSSAITLDNCRIKTFDIALLPQAIDIYGSNGSAIDLVRWTDPATDTKKKKAAWLDNHSVEIGKIEWISPLGNRFKFESEGSMTITF